MASQFSVSATTLSSIASATTYASDGLEELASGVPVPPSAGAADAMISDLMVHLVSAASRLSLDALEAAERVTTSSWMYAGADQCVADALPTDRW